MNPESVDRADIVTTEPVAPLQRSEGAENDEPIIAEPVDLQGPVTVGEIVEGAAKIVDGVATGARRLVDRGRYRKVRISRKGKSLLPDIPLAAVAVIEAASLFGAGLPRVLAVNVGARFLFDIDVVNEADRFLEIGRKALLDGDLDTADEALNRAVRIDDTHAEAFMQLGVLNRLRGDADAARANLERAKILDDLGDVGQRAAGILRSMDGTKDA